MKNSEELMKARRTISNGRWIVVVCVLIIIGSITKLIYFGTPDSVSGTATALVEASTFNAIVALFPSIGSKELFSPDNVVLISTILAFVYGIKLLKKGHEDLEKIK